MQNITPSVLALEIEKHSNYLCSVEMGFTKISKKKKAEHKNYILELKAKLFEITKLEPEQEALSDEDLLSELELD
jgi:hypothetical protein